MLEVTNLHTYHGYHHALQGVSLKMAPGEIIAVVGANGAGKSTLLGTIAGLYNPRSGRVTLAGQDVTGLGAETVVRRGLSLVPERRQVFSTLSTVDNLVLGAYHRRRQANLAGEIEQAFTLFPELRPHAHRPAGALSGGMQQMLAIARGLMSHPRLILLDEPTLGLAPLVAAEILNTLEKLRRQGTAVLLVEQNARAALKTANRVYVLERGRLVASGTPTELADNPIIHEAYLGLVKDPQPAAKVAAAAASVAN